MSVEANKALVRRLVDEVWNQGNREVVRVGAVLLLRQPSTTD